MISADIFIKIGVNMKKFKKIISCIVLISVISALSAFTNINALALEEPEISAKAAYLYEATSGSTLYSKNADEKMYPASTTKIMTALLAIEKISDGDISESDEVTASESAFTGLVADGSTANIQPGETMTLSDLLHCILIASANEACNIVAEYIAGDIDSFVSLMNTRASELGCTGTHFTNTHGLPDDNHYTTAHDLSIIYSAAYSYPIFDDIVGTAKYHVPATNMSGERELENTNRLIISTDTYYHYEYCTGGKTGHTNAAGYCLASSAEHNGLVLISVVMGAEAVEGAGGGTVVNSFLDSADLFRYGFNNFSYRTILEEGTLIEDVPVIHGDGADSVIVCPSSSVTAFLPNDLDIANATYDIEITDADEDGNLSAPIEKGQILGKMVMHFDGKDYGPIELISNRNVDLQKIEFVKDEIHKIFSNTWVKLFIIFVLVLFAFYIFLVVRYNRIRKRKYKSEVRAARSRLYEMEKSAPPTTGKSFEDIEAKYEHFDKMNK